MTPEETLAAATELLRTDPVEALSAFDAIVANTEFDQSLRADASYASARCALQSGNPTDALHRISVARDLHREAGQDLAALRTDLGRINVLDDLGRHVEASMVGQHLIEALEASHSDGEDEELRSWLYAAALENQGASMGCLGHHDAAARFLSQAADAYLTVGAPADQARVEANLGVEQLELGRTDEALSLLTAAREKLEAEGEEDLARRCAVYAAQADALAGRYQRALDGLSGAHAGSNIDEALQDIDGIRLLIARAEVLSVLHLWPELDELARTLEKATDDAKMHRDLAQVRVLLARAAYRQGQRDEAGSTARAAITSLDELKLPARAARARLALAEILPEPEAIVEVKAALEAFDQSGEAWGIAAATILGAEIVDDDPRREQWAYAAAATEAAAFPELAWRLDTVTGHLARRNEEPAEAAKYYASALSQLRELRTRIEGDLHRLPFMSDRRSPLESLVTLAIESDQIELARAISAEERSWMLRSSPSTAPTFPTGTVLYQSLGEQLSAFVTTASGKTSFVPLEVTTDELASARRRLQSQWRRIADPRMRVHLDQLRPAAEQLLQDLYLRLFAPIEALLEPELPVIIIPVGSMSGIPFQALHDGLSYLIERREVHVAPSDGLASPHRPNSTLVVGVPDSVAPEIEREVRQIADSTMGTLLLSEAATKQSFADAIVDHDVVHIACHARFRPENPLMSALHLADGWLSADEIQHLPLDDKLIVLASCSSGLQGSVGEDETLGLPRAFLNAGASAVVMNLWPADDLVSVGLMTRFHTNLKALPPNQALRAAQLEMMYTHPHPLLWAAPVVFGHADLLPAMKGTPHEASSAQR
ncbi:MAG: CHAT domain-containing protein [Acidimicrobiales bacterium]|nr:CHAT domain-containing protein [Acidimicrobiales bacterium]RZV46085.1 MAG: CHAT domain-containing protein [Acidimicrobiales bacterium]